MLLLFCFVFRHAVRVELVLQLILKKQKKVMRVFQRVYMAL